MSLSLWFHSLICWAVLTGLLYALYRAYPRIPASGLDFTKHDEAVRHWTATLEHYSIDGRFSTC